MRCLSLALLRFSGAALFPIAAMAAPASTTGRSDCDRAAIKAAAEKLGDDSGGEAGLSIVTVVTKDDSNAQTVGLVSSALGVIVEVDVRTTADECWVDGEPRIGGD